MQEEARDFGRVHVDAVLIPREHQQTSTLGIGWHSRYRDGRFECAGYEVAEYPNKRENNSGWGLMLLALCLVSIVAVVALYATTH